MRLIDLDKAVSICDEDNNTVIFANIGNAEVKAIPIEWIKKWCNKEHNRKSLEERLLKRYGVITMLDDWEEENEESSNRD